MRRDNNKNKRMIGDLEQKSMCGTWGETVTPLEKERKDLKGMGKEDTKMEDIWDRKDMEKDSGKIGGMEKEDMGMERDTEKEDTGMEKDMEKEDMERDTEKMGRDSKDTVERMEEKMEVEWALQEQGPDSFRVHQELWKNLAFYAEENISTNHC